MDSGGFSVWFQEKYDVEVCGGVNYVKVKITFSGSVLNMSEIWMNSNLERMCESDDRGEDEECFVLQDLSVWGSLKSNDIEIC